MSWTGRSEVGAEEESFMEILDSELVCFGAEYKKFSTDDSCSLVTSTCSTSSAATTITSSQSSTTAEEVTNDGRSNKKQRKGGSANSLGTIKVRKDKLGDKISALQQLVSPFGKSDTASVLHEALGYIGFLHDQVQVLSSPYLLQRLPTTTAARLQLQGGEYEDQSGGGGGGGGEVLSDLRSRGLCLVPISCTGNVANDNGADFWSCALGSNGLNCSKH